MFYLDFLTQALEPGDEVTRAFIEHMLPHMLEVYAESSAKGGEHGQTVRIDEATRQRWEEKCDQSMVSHLVNGIFPTMRLINWLENLQLGPTPISDVERRLYILAYLMHDIDKIKGLPEHTRRQLLKSDRGSWSAGTTKPLPNGWRLVILNPTHGKERSAATLMEEICHVWLGHTPGKLHSMDENGLRARDYNESDERAAYGVGAAVLVPYSVLRLAVENGVPAEEIAKRYGVSRDLVEFRIKVTHLWDEYKQKVLKTTA